MDLAGNVVVVTGSAGGIGRALARRFHAAGTSGVVVADTNAAGAAGVADELNARRPGSAMALTSDISTEAGNRELIAATEERFGPIDLFFANAGVGGGTDLETPQSEWRNAFAVNIEAHVFAAQLLVPGWVDRGYGYFCSTASAAGLLTQIGSWPYSVTKHAAVGFAEWLSVTYGDRGVRVSCLCPMGVNTNMLSSPTSSIGSNTAGDVVRAAGAVLEPEDVAEVVLAGITDERFLFLPHPEVLTFWQRKTTDYDRWLGGMRRLQSRVQGS